MCAATAELGRTSPPATRSAAAAAARCWGARPPSCARPRRTAGSRDSAPQRDGATAQRAGSRGFLPTVLAASLPRGLFLCCVALCFKTKLVTVTEELNSRLRREAATLSTLAAPAGSEGTVGGPERQAGAPADAAQLARLEADARAARPGAANLRQLLAEAPPLAAAAPPSITVVLRYVSADALCRQLGALLGQTARAKEIWVCAFQAADGGRAARDVVASFEHGGAVTVVSSSGAGAAAERSGTSGLRRLALFQMALQASTRHVLVLDPDVRPGARLLQTLAHAAELPAGRGMLGIAGWRALDDATTEATPAPASAAAGDDDGGAYRGCSTRRLASLPRLLEVDALRGAWFLPTTSTFIPRPPALPPTTAAANGGACRQRGSRRRGWCRRGCATQTCRRSSCPSPRTTAARRRPARRPAAADRRAAPCLAPRALARRRGDALPPWPRRRRRRRRRAARRQRGGGQPAGAAGASSRRLGGSAAAASAARRPRRGGARPCTSHFGPGPALRASNGRPRRAAAPAAAAAARR